MALVSIGVAATIGVFGTSSRTTRAQRGEVAVQQAQAEIDRLSTLRVRPAGAHLRRPPPRPTRSNPAAASSRHRFTVRTGLTETSSYPRPRPGRRWSTPARALLGRLRRRGGHRQDLPVRLVARRAVPDSDLRRLAEHQAHLGRRDPRSEPPTTPLARRCGCRRSSRTRGAPARTRTGTTRTTGPQSSAQSFYLYDTRCGLTPASATTASHFTHNTASTARPGRQLDLRAAGDTTKQPDLMGTTPPSSSTTLYDYSADLTGGYGRPRADAARHELPDLLLGRRHEQPAPRTKWNVHSWATNPSRARSTSRAA